MSNYTTSDYALAKFRLWSAHEKAGGEFVNGFENKSETECGDRAAWWFGRYLRLAMEES